MNSSIKNLNQALAFQLEGAYEIVKQLQVNVSRASKAIADEETRFAFIEYKEILNEQRLRLKRIFSYLLTGPYKRKISTHTIADWNEIEGKDMLPRLRDVLLCNSLQSAIKYLITTYTDARYIAMRLELDVVVTLLDEIVDGEEEVSKKMKRLASTQVNQACLLVMN